VKLLVTGGAGFIGSCFVRQAVLEHGDDVVVLDALTYAGNLENLADLEGHESFRFVRGSITDFNAVERAIDGRTAVVNFAAETHVDRSIYDAAVFLDTNVGGARVLMDAALGAKARFVQVSTDEIYGSLGASGRFQETSPLDPSSPYAASKAAADLLVLAYRKTYGLDAVITRCGNNYGPRQFPEKLIPLFITNALEDRQLPLYGDGLNVRDWIHVEDHCRAIRLVLERATAGAVYNISAESERTNREICRIILAELGKPESLVRFVEDRPGHDRRYALDPGRLRADLGWSPQIALADGLSKTIAWYRENRGWWERIKSGEYARFYEQHYGRRFAPAGGERRGGSQS
jgi:dTDP-glucose 4,6-dehydratase